MSERRPHWDDDLLASVMTHCNDIEQCHAAIAAVEDWHEKFVMHGAFRVLAERAASAEADRDRLANQLLNEVPDSYIQMKARALTAEAAIERVRELCEAKTQEVAASDPLFGPPCALYVDDILRALDGGAE